MLDRVLWAFQFPIEQITHFKVTYATLKTVFNHETTPPIPFRTAKIRQKQP